MIRRVTRLCAITFLALVLAAIVIQDFTDVMPAGVFNTGRGVYAAVLWVVVALVVVGLIVLLVDLLRPGKAGGVVGGLVAFAVIVEVCVGLADVALMSRSPQAPLGGPYYEERTVDGNWIILRKHGNESRFGFRTDEPYSVDKGDAFRLLLLGDSFTEGSGRRAECNYPTVVERGLSRRLGRDLSVMNAGVSGYGPAQALILLRELTARGYEFDAVVYHFLTENDFTDGLPGTERRAVAGMAFRFPRSRFLRTFHPLNSRTFRTAMFLRALIRIRYELDDFSAPQPGPCNMSGEPLSGELPLTLRDIAMRKSDDAARVLSSPALIDHALASVAAMRDEAASLGVPFVLVVFPDRLSVDTELQRLLDVGSETLHRLEQLRTVVRERLDGARVIDASPAFEGRAGLYRRVDTHLSDLGNVVAGEWVAARLIATLELE